MNYAYDADSGFYNFALTLFTEAGLTDAEEPVYSNHSPDQMIYFDSLRPVNYSKFQRSVLKTYIHNISLLFEMGYNAFERPSHKKIRVFSAELFCDSSERSQTACYVHTHLVPAAECDASVFLFEHNNMMMISIINFNHRCYLSDWYNIYDYGEFVDKLNILNTRVDTASNFLSDLVYSVARDYYTHPVSVEAATYLTLPDNYLVVNNGIKLSREELKEMIQDALKYYENKYGDDYVYDKQIDASSVATSDSDLDHDIDMMLLSLDNEEETTSNTFEGIFDDAMHDNDSPNKGTSEASIRGLPPEVFRDPVLMVKWLEEHSNDSS